MKKLLLLGLLAVGVAGNAARAAAPFGERTTFTRGDLRFPEFSLRFLERDRHNPTGTALDAVKYTFAVIGPDGKLVTKLKFSRGAFNDGLSVFEVAGKKYAAEMFYSTLGLGPGPQWEMPPANRLNFDEILIWDEASAKAGNALAARAMSGQ
jgi:hypothetical protein